MATTVPPLTHGTDAGYQAHHKRDESPCTPCREAHAQHMRDYRAGDAVRRHRDRWWNSTRQAALEQLAAEHPARFWAILTEIRAETQVPGKAA